MPDYHSPTVVQPAVPLADMSPLERLLLTHMLDGKIDDRAQTLYAYSEFGAVHRPIIVIGDLQDIVRRSPKGTCFSVLTSYTCTRMQPDGFGGSASLVSADLVQHRSTDDLLEEFVGDAMLAEA